MHGKSFEGGASACEGPFAGLVRSGNCATQGCQRQAAWHWKAALIFAYSAATRAVPRGVHVGTAIAPATVTVFRVAAEYVGVGAEVWRVLSKCHEIRNLGEYERRHECGRPDRHRLDRRLPRGCGRGRCVATDCQGMNHPAASFESRFIEAGGLRLHYLDYGTAGLPPMLCIHGGGAHAHWFDFVAPGFTDKYHVRALDLRGHGESAWSVDGDYSFERFSADIAEVAEQLDLRDFVLVGHSRGGMISMMYAASRPPRLGKLVVVDSTMRFLRRARRCVA